MNSIYFKQGWWRSNTGKFPGDGQRGNLRVDKKQNFSIHWQKQGLCKGQEAWKLFNRKHLGCQWGQGVGCQQWVETVNSSVLQEHGVWGYTQLTWYRNTKPCNLCENWYRIYNHEKPWHRQPQNWLSGLPCPSRVHVRPLQQVIPIRRSSQAKL